MEIGRAENGTIRQKSSTEIHYDLQEEKAYNEPYPFFIALHTSNTNVKAGKPKCRQNLYLSTD